MGTDLSEMPEPAIIGVDGRCRHGGRHDGARGVVGIAVG
jgi:hypothetical protein